MMDKSGHFAIASVPYRAGVGVPPGVEVLDFPGLLARAAGHGVEVYSPKRNEFHELIAIRSGTLRGSVDFTEHELRAGDWLWICPGQVHQYGSDLRTVDGLIVLFPAAFLGAATAVAAGVDRGAWRQPRALADAEREALWATLALLDGEYRQWGALPPEIHLDVLRHLLSVLVLRLAHRRGVPGRRGGGDGGGGDREGGDGGGGGRGRATGGGTGSGVGGGGEAFQRFRRAVERDFLRTHRVEDYAARLGYSVRTLTRATRAAAGCGAKQFIDDRVLLEAKRLLVHTDLPAAAVGQRLGFPGATVFTKFFRQRTGETPSAFRARAAAATRHG
jgi:AraC-like DNA-binding protein